mmetsp:Transcript_42376/g.117962  ORF Transcript_42376/g.117962 Transcript_42376/m.117962 type:complete len:214 (-) Transcript_42376:348-989(-)
MSIVGCRRPWPLCSTRYFRPEGRCCTPGWESLRSRRRFSPAPGTSRPAAQAQHPEKQALAADPRLLAISLALALVSAAAPAAITTFPAPGLDPLTCRCISCEAMAATSSSVGRRAALCSFFNSCPAAAAAAAAANSLPPGRLAGGASFTAAAVLAPAVTSILTGSCGGGAGMPSVMFTWRKPRGLPLRLSGRRCLPLACCTSTSPMRASFWTL